MKALLLDTPELTSFNKVLKEIMADGSAKKSETNTAIFPPAVNKNKMCRFLPISLRRSRVLVAPKISRKKNR
jgi:hypothetical protein